MKNYYKAVVVVAAVAAVGSVMIYVVVDKCEVFAVVEADKQ